MIPFAAFLSQERCGRNAHALLKQAFDQIVMVAARFVKWSGVRRHPGIRYKHLARAVCVC